MGFALGFVAENAQASGEPDTAVLSVTPGVTYGVQIDSVTSATTAYNFTTVALGGSTISTAAIVLHNTGTVPEYFSMAISNTSGNWTAVNTSPTNDQFRLAGIINTTTQPNGSSFADYLLNPPVPVNASTLYGQTRTANGATKNLWLQLDMPASIVNGGTLTQTMTLTVNGQGS